MLFRNSKQTRFTTFLAPVFKCFGIAYKLIEEERNKKLQKTLIYIIGAGRSGTTLLDIFLGNNENTISLGEINRFERHEGFPPERDSKSEVYTYWLSVKKRLEARLEIDYGCQAKTARANEYHSAAHKIVSGNLDKSYVSFLDELYKIILESREESVLIESSKYPLRALNLSKILENKPVTISYIYLKRNPVNVVNSFQKKDVEQPYKNYFAANLYYMVVNVLAELVISKLKRRGHKIVRLTYEDFVGAPVKTAHKIATKLDINLDTLVDKLETNKPLTTGLIFEGNRIRLKQSLKIHNKHSKEKPTLRSRFTKYFNFLIYNQ